MARCCLSPTLRKKKTCPSQLRLFSDRNKCDSFLTVPSENCDLRPTGTSQVSFCLGEHCPSESRLSSDRSKLVLAVAKLASRFGPLKCWLCSGRHRVIRRQLGWSESRKFIVQSASLACGCKRGPRPLCASNVATVLRWSTSMLRRFCGNQIIISSFLF